ncbi:MAG: DNA translocase FtsK [Verrucomicrobia bacterium]|nr:DNA translocase FtsK [Verrucomicrobiota bacterium]
MSKAASSNPNNGPSFQAPRHRPRWVTASICAVVAVLLGVAFIDYRPEQVPLITTNPTDHNAVGLFGAYVTFYLLYWFGVGAWLVPAFLGWMTYVALRNVRQLVATRGVAVLLCLLAGAGLADMVGGFTGNYFPKDLGGSVGHWIYNGFLAELMGGFGSALLLGIIYILSLIFILTTDIGAEFDRLFHAFQEWRVRQKELKAHQAEMLAEARAAAEKRKVDAGKTIAIAPAPPTNKKLEITRDPFRPPSRSPFAKPAESAAAAETPTNTPQSPAGNAPGELITAPATSDSRIIRSTATPPSNAGNPHVAIVKPEETKKARASAVPASETDYQFPPLTLLKEQVQPASADTDTEHLRNLDDLIRILGEFGVTVTPGEIHVGPVITCYEVVPAPGVRVEKIANLDKNIALGMRAQSVRILAPIPGKAAVGIEIPNRTPTPVGMREILESEDWVSAKAEIPIALGKDVSGKPLISDLAKMPHLLIAGATGSGKSVCINSIIASIVYRKSPKDLRLIMVDPKVVELKVFNTLPHMLIPVVTEPKKVPSALKWLLGEMEQRYQIFAKVGVRNIVGFNTRKKNAAGSSADASETPAQGGLSGIDPAATPDDGLTIPERLPYIVAIIDELADLMMVAPAEIETSIARLAQLARAAGIHLIIATQRPSVNVITGVIKANLPSRIAFQVASQVDSRTILDGKGADTLIGRGDMLFSPPGTSRLVRAQGAFVSDEEVAEFVEFLKRNGPPKYAENVQNQIEDDAAANSDNDEEVEDDGDVEDDEKLYKKAMGVLRATKRASTSTLQRRLRIGYNRAARIVDLMEERGIVGPENGSSPREILVDLDKL